MGPIAAPGGPGWISGWNRLEIRGREQDRTSRTPGALPGADLVAARGLPGGDGSAEALNGRGRGGGGVLSLVNSDLLHQQGTLAPARRREASGRKRKRSGGSGIF